METKRGRAGQRRTFLKQVGGMAGLALAASSHAAGPGGNTEATSVRTVDSAAAADSAGLVYQSLGVGEGACVEAIVNVMCPEDGFTPNGVSCGLHVYIDRQLAGAFGRGDRLYRQGPWRPGKPEYGYQSPLSPEEYFKSGIAALQSAAMKRTGKSVDALAPEQLDGLLMDTAAGKLDDEHFALAAWFNEMFYPLFAQACFADPLYGGNRGKVFWRMVGYPGLPAFHERNVVEFRGRQFPGAADPKSMSDFS